MDLGLRDKTALITASSKGIGRGVALGLAREGCRVVLTSSNADNLATAEKHVKQETGAEVASFLMDVSSLDAVDRACDAIATRFPTIDILVANGPGPRPMSAVGLDWQEMQRAVTANLLSVVRLCDRFVPGMIERKFGRVIALTSTTGKEPDEGMVASNVCRAGVVAYVKTLSREVAKHGITANTILTGGVMTDRSVSLFKRDAEAMKMSYEALVEQASKTIPVGFISSPDQFAPAVVFLASPAAGYVNGVSLAIDGGFMRSM